MRNYCPSSPLWLGDCPSFYRPRRNQFTSMPNRSSDVWRLGVQCHGVDGCPGESRFWWGVMACPVRVQEWLRGGWHIGCSFEGHPHEDSRVSLTLGRTRHNGWRGGVPSPHTSTASGMVMQWPGWLHRAHGDGGDHSHRPDVTAPSRAATE
jgi:hypothetical protein